MSIAHSIAEQLSRCRGRILITAVTYAVLVAPIQPASAEANLNRVPNPEFFGDQGNSVGTVTGTVPNFWRAFAVGGGDLSMEIVPLAADVLYVGSPATNAVKITVNAFGADQGFDHEASLFALAEGHPYFASVYMKTGNSDNSSQQVNVAFPVFDSNGFTGRAPGSFAATVTSTWSSFSGSSFTEVAGTVADLGFRPTDDGGENSVLIALPTVDGPPSSTPEPNYPPIFSAGRDFSSTDKFVSTMVFHWYSAITGQQEGPWRPFEGRLAWTGEVPFWRDQVKDIMDANIDVMYVHLFGGFDYAREQLFTALNQLRREGYATPYVLPFLDPLIIWNGSPVDVAQVAGKDEYVGWYTRWFEQYFRNNPDASAESYLLHIDGKIVLNTWHNNPGFVTNIGSLTRADVESRLSSAYAAQYPSFVNGIYQMATANGFAPPYADEIGHQFSNTEYFSTNTFAGKRPATMKAGYWDQNVRTPGTFFPRNGGIDYTNAWSQLNADALSPPIYHAYVESWNEYDEGTGIYAGDTGSPYISPMNTSGNDDQWSTTNNPREYINTTRSGAALFNDAPDLDSLVLWHNIPSTMEPGATADVSILVRNTGDTKWSHAAGIVLAQSNSDSQVWGPATIAIDDVDNEVSKYGGVFRGRPVLFEFAMTAPLSPGQYNVNYQMQSSSESFGAVLSVDIQVAGLLQVLALSDVTGDSIDDVAVMREGSILAEIRSGSNGALQKTITFLSDAFTAIDAAALPDADGNGIAELAVLGTRNSDDRIVVEIRNLSGPELPRQVFFAPNHTPYAIAVVADDADNNGVVELAVLSTRNSDGRMLVEVKNAFGATNPKALWYMAGNTPVDLEVVPDKDANGIPEIAVLSSRISDGRIVTELKNAAGASLPSAVWFMPGNTAIDLVAVDDKDANGIPEVAVLSSRNSNGRNVVEIKNAVGATNATAVWFIAGFTATDVAHIHDADNNGVPEVAVLSVRDSDGRIVVEVKNVIGATNANSMWYSPGFTARGLATIDDSDNNGVEEALVLMIRDSDGRILVEGRNAAGNPAPKQYWFSP